jgi:Met-10+ like-protein
MTAKYVKNWYLLLALHANLVSKMIARFRDGQQIVVFRHDYLLFYEELYRRHLQNEGFIYRKMEKKIIVQTPDGLQITLNPTLTNNVKTYSFVLDEIFVMKVYGEPNLQGRVVIDLGASLGDSALYFAKLGASKVYGYEPNVEYYELAQENIKLNDMAKKIHIFNESATGDKVKDLIAHHHLQNIFLKIDCDGCEYDFTENLDNTIFDNITDIVMEYHGKPKPLIENLVRVGYKVHSKKNLFWKTTDGILVAKKPNFYSI